MASYFTSYYDVGSKKVGERVVTNDEQIIDLLHVVQESVRQTYVSNSIK